MSEDERSIGECIQLTLWQLLMLHSRLISCCCIYPLRTSLCPKSCYSVWMRTFHFYLFGFFGKYSNDQIKSSSRMRRVGLYEGPLSIHGVDYWWCSALHRSPQFWSSYTGHSRDVGKYIPPFIPFIARSKPPHLTAQLCFQHGEWEKIGWSVLCTFDSRETNSTSSRHHQTIVQWNGSWYALISPKPKGWATKYVGECINPDGEYSGNGLLVGVYACWRL